MTAAYYIGEEARTGCVIHRHASGQVDLADEPDGEPFVIMAPVSDAPCPGHVVIGAHPPSLDPVGNPDSRKRKR